MNLLDSFLDECRSAIESGSDAVHSVVTNALSDPERFGAAVRERPKPWFFAADEVMTVFCTDGRPGSASAPHDHGTWSVLGCFSGAEESWWYEPHDGGLTSVGTGLLRSGDAHQLRADVVHSVMNRWNAPNGIVHVYAGNFLALDRHIWDPVSGVRHQAGLAEPYAPLPGSSGPAIQVTADSSGPSLAGTAFVALAVDDVPAVSDWLTATFGLQSLTDDRDSCAVDEQYRYLLEPSSLTIVGVHRRADASAGGIDHVALRVPGLEALDQWRTQLETVNAGPSPITRWNYGSFVEVVGPEQIRIRLFVPERRA
jgi:hypothetical protein